LSSLCDMPPQGHAVSIWVDTYVREDALKLFGFMTFEDRQAFGMLRSVSGIGPKIALAIISTLDAKSLRQTVVTNRVELLESVPGIGKRTAEKLMLELRPKMEKLSFVSPNILGASKSSHEKSHSKMTRLEFDEFDATPSSTSPIENHLLDLRSALENLGYKEKEILPVLATVRSEFVNHTDLDFQLVLKSALKSMRAQV